jgi:hypothetical protein
MLKKTTREEMKAEALRLMDRLNLKDEIINELRDENHVNMTEQWIKDIPEVAPGLYQTRTYFGLKGEAYDVYPLSYGLNECYEALAEFETETGGFVYHMHYSQSAFVGPQLALFYISNATFFSRDDNDEAAKDFDIEDEWHTMEQNATEYGILPVCCINLDTGDREFADISFCITDNGCIMRL